MAGAYKWRLLSECDINDPFFDSLKYDYPEFENWYLKKAREEKQAFTYIDENGLGAFVMLKFDEVETIQMQNGKLPTCKRLKISTLKLSDRVQGNRLGEGAIGIALWNWLESDDEEIYVTVYDKHMKLIEMLKKFGFILAGYNPNNDGIYVRSKKEIDFSTPYTSFPFINQNQNEFALLPIDEKWHDKLFPYSELKNTKQETEEFAAANGMTKTYLFFPYSEPVYKENQPILIYRKFAGENKKFKSVITSYGTIVRCIKIKQNYVEYMALEDYKVLVGKKSVFSSEEIESFYSQRNLYVLEIVYDHAFGEGNNVNYFTLKNNGIWKDGHPFQAMYSMSDFKSILSYAKQNIGKLIK